MTKSSFDLRAALRGRSPEQLAVLLRRAPALTEALHGRGPLAAVGPYGSAYHRAPGGEQATVERLAVLLGSGSGIDVTLAALDACARQLVTLAVWHGGAVRRQEVLTEAGEDHVSQIDAAAASLEDLLLTDPSAGWVVLRPGVAGVARLPGVRVRDGLARASTEVLAGMLRGLDVALPQRLADRLAALEESLADGDVVRAAAARLSPDAIRILNVLLAEGTCRVADVGIAHYDPWRQTDTPLHELARSALVGIDPYEQRCWVWLDVVVGLQGALFVDWPVAPDVAPSPLADTAGLPPALGRLDALLGLWTREPAQALQSGGLGVRPVRAAAKVLGRPAEEVGLLASLAVWVGLLGQVQVGTKGRGRTLTRQHAWTATALAEQFSALPPERRWALLVQAWRDEPRLDETDGLPQRVERSDWSGAPLARGALLRLLASQPAGTGLALDDLADLAEFHTPLLLPAQSVPHLVAAARVLGLVPPDGPVGLTALGRALLDGVDALAAALPPPRTEFTVQADLSVVAPPDLAPDVGSGLERYADLESATGARLYRLSEARIAAALDTGEDADGILAFLGEHATAPLAQNVDYLVRDCQRRHGRVRVGGCASYVRSDDAALLSRAVTVKPAKLRLLAPTVAVSSLPRAKVATALRARGLMPVAEDADGAVLLTAAPRAAPGPAPDRSLPALRATLEVAAAEADRLAVALLATPPPAPPSRQGAQGRRPAQSLGHYVHDERWLDPSDDLDFEDDWDDVYEAELVSGREILRQLIEGRGLWEAN